MKVIEGIGPKIEALLIEAGIKTYESLANASIETLKSVLANGGKMVALKDPSTWAEQAKLAAEGKWDNLSQLQLELFAGNK